MQDFNKSEDITIYLDANYALTKPDEKPRVLFQLPPNPVLQEPTIQNLTAV